MIADIAGIWFFRSRRFRAIPAISAIPVEKAGLLWVFTEGHADMDFTDFFDDLKDLDKVDWALMQARYWNDTNDDPDRKRRRQAEFLVHKFFPWELVSYIGVYDRSVAETVGEIIQGGSPEVGIQRGWYF